MESNTNTEVESVTQQENPVQENYFDRNITKIVFYVNAFVAIFYVIAFLLSVYIVLTFPDFVKSFLFKSFNFLVSHFWILVIAVPIVSLSLGVFNYRNKRKAILKGLVYSLVAYLFPLCLFFLMLFFMSNAMSGH